MKTFKYLVWAFALCAVAVAQTPTGQRVVPTDGPGGDEYTIVASKSGNNTYICNAKSFQDTPYALIPTVTAGSTTSLAITSHGFHALSSPTVTISGATGNWAAINGNFKASYVDANTITIPVNSTGFGTVTGTIVFSFTAPRVNQPVWKVVRSTDDGAGAITKMWAAGGYYNTCSSPSTLSYQ